MPEVIGYALVGGITLAGGYLLGRWHQRFLKGRQRLKERLAAISK